MQPSQPPGWGLSLAAALSLYCAASRSSSRIGGGRSAGLLTEGERRLPEGTAALWNSAFMDLSPARLPRVLARLAGLFEATAVPGVEVGAAAVALAPGLPSAAQSSTAGVVARGASPPSPTPGKTLAL